MMSQKFTTLNFPFLSTIFSSSPVFSHLPNTHLSCLPQNKDLSLSLQFPILFHSTFSSSSSSSSSSPPASFLILQIFISQKLSLLFEDMANAASGMAVVDECKLKFLELKSKRNYRYIIFKIENHVVVVEKLGNPEETYEDFTASLPADECRYSVFDFDFITNENCQKSKIFFIAWAPDSAKVRSKMVYASSKDRFKRELDGIQVELQATDPSEMSFDIIKARAL